MRYDFKQTTTWNVFGSSLCVFGEINPRSSRAWLDEHRMLLSQVVSISAESRHELR
jgi:hypothetical protein